MSQSLHCLQVLLLCVEIVELGPKLFHEESESLMLLIGSFQHNLVIFKLIGRFPKSSFFCIQSFSSVSAA
jgi:hypothetical protein